MWSVLVSLVLANPLWGAPRIHGELLKLGIGVSQASVAKYMPRHDDLRHRRGARFSRIMWTRPWPRISSSCQPPHIGSSSCLLSWRIIVAGSFTWPSPPIHGGVDRPTIARGVPGDAVPRYLIRDRDHAFAEIGRTASGMGIHEVLTAARSPWQNAYAERLIGSVRRECLDHVIVMNEIGLPRILTRYLAYYHQSRTHLSLTKDSPRPRPIAPPTIGPVVASPQVGGLHHRYDRPRGVATSSLLPQSASPGIGRRSSRL
jgi:hypothetical protein